MSQPSVTLTGEHGPVILTRNTSGVAHVTALELNDTLFGLGYCHARDRGLQMLLLRILGQGRGCELLDPAEEMLAVDKFFRRAALQRDAAVQDAALSTPARAFVNAYCRGVNAYFKRHGIPWELRLHRYRFKRHPWTSADVFLTAKVIGYLMLAHSQGAMEKLIVQCVQHGLPREQLEELFPGQLAGLDEELLRKVQLEEGVIPEALKWTSALPHALASNNWVVAGSKTASGKPCLANDPHLEVNRLPPVWYETVLRWRVQGAYRYVMGGTLPGAPGVVLGRTPDLAWGVTYALMDSVDSWIEECRDGQYHRGEEWRPFLVRRETIRFKTKFDLRAPVRLTQPLPLRKRPPVELVFYENEHGVLEGNPQVPGYYLATRWACLEETSADSLEAMLGVMTARNVEAGRQWLGRLNISSWNWVLADREGNIGYQMSGKLPRRRDGISGLVPLPGWDPANDWQGFAAVEELPRAFNPADGLLVTANQDLNHLGRVRPINLPMAPYRAERIGAVLGAAQKLTTADLTKLQMDVISPQAGRFLEIVKPLLPEFEAKHGENCAHLRHWDLNYTAGSYGAFLFEHFYRALLEEVFGFGGTHSFGSGVLQHLLDRTPLFIEFYGHFDTIMLAEKSAWFGHRSRADLYRAALSRALTQNAEPYGHRRKIRLQNMFFRGKLWPWLGFDRGPIPLLGNRATVHQGQIFRSAQRETTIGPSLRLVTDMATDEMHTTLPGGASDRRWSPWYANEIQDWLHGRFKVLQGYGGDPGAA